jgi:hypothetical protein
MHSLGSSELLYIGWRHRHHCSSSALSKDASIVGSDIAHSGPLTLFASMGHWFIGSFDETLLFPLLLGSLPGIIIGTYLARRAPERALRMASSFVFCGVGVKLVW